MLSGTGDMGVVFRSENYDPGRISARSKEHSCRLGFSTPKLSPMVFDTVN